MNWKAWLLLAFSVFWAATTGIFFAAPGFSIWVGLSGLAIAVIYAALICLFQRPVIWLAIAVTILLVLALLPLGIEGYVVGMTISVNFWVFGQLGMGLLKLMPSQQVFRRLAPLFAGSLGLGWAVSSIFG